MLKILKGQDQIRRIIVCEESGNASSLPLLLHFLSTTSSSNQKVAIVSSRFTETNYKLICSKAGVRWDPSKITFSDVLQPFGYLDVTANQLMEQIRSNITESNPCAVLFDDLSILEQFGAKSVEVAVFVHEMYTLLSNVSPEHALVFASFSIPTNTISLLRSRCNVLIHLNPVGHGFGKEASSKAVLTIRDSDLRTTKKGILLSGERAINGTWITVD
ncbi:unnamed protein product [Caenorhabditis sp. 36 PRJEB53466]|nr:unnamed protein product [Caenorhabditis sp. 36 PRJEB53466]